MSRFGGPAFALILLGGAATVVAPQIAHAQLFADIRVRLAPPPLPIYAQPPLPGADYIWTPGYWAWDQGYGDYYWVPGTWVRAPRQGYLWTPNWWGWEEGVYLFHRGYWGQHIGYYGGVNYGFGYTGFGFEGGYWQGPHYFYNRAVNNVTNINITNVYNKTVIVNRTNVTRASYNGGPGGVVARPTPAQAADKREGHIQATPMQVQHIQAAHANRALFASANHGAPPLAATARPAQFSGPGVRAADGARPAEPFNHPPGRGEAGRPPSGGFGQPQAPQRPEREHQPMESRPIEHGQPHAAPSPRPMAPPPQFHAPPRAEPRRPPAPHPERQPEPRPELHPQPRSEPRPDSQRDPRQR